jgi:pyridoxal/pyridoxine/pyridoxamine kinase
MPARIVVALNDRALGENVTELLWTMGQDVIAFTDSMAALTALEQADTIKVLVTSVEFRRGIPNGIALSRMAQVKRPGIQTVFLGAPEIGQLTAGLGELLPATARGTEIVAVVVRMLGSADQKPG